MARNNRNISRANRNIQNIAQGISGTMDSLYRTTYMSSPQQGRDLEDLTAQINDNIDKIVNRNMDTIGMPSVSKLYARAAGTNSMSQNQIMADLEKMFNNGIITDDLYGMFMSNRYLKELDNEIDTVCKYMPKLEEALETQKDSVLSADHFSKDFLNLVYPRTDVDETTFNERVKDLKKKYQLAKLVEEIYEATSKYGEQFVYRVPYSIAIGRLLATKPDVSLVAPTRVANESAEEEKVPQNEIFVLTMDSTSCSIQSETGIVDGFDSKNPSVIVESAKADPTIPDGKVVTQESKPILSSNERFRIGIEICRSNIIESAVKNYGKAMEQKKKFHEQSMANLHEASIFSKQKQIQKNIEAKGNIHFGDNPMDSRIIANDGLIAGDAPSIVDVKTPGCVVKKLERDQVLPIYIDDMCMGYYYFELRTTDTSESFMGFKNILGDPLTNMRGDSRTPFNTVDNQRQDDAIRYVAGQLSTFIDKQFVNNNQDLAKEIYMILKYNDLFNTPSIDLIKVTFIPPEDMVHFFFRQDPITHRGISDLDRALIPGKIYSSLYVTSSIGFLTRSNDKRVYYVKQTVDTNIAQTLLTTIAQIKQGNFGIRQFQNINNILNITGRFNDYIIPTNNGGDPPIQFEVMPGQDIQTPTELMESLEEMAVNSTNIPIEVIQARQSVDYAMQLTMSNSRVLRFCYKRQELFEPLLSQLISPIYNYEYDESTEIKITLPPPSFLNVTNTTQLIDNTKNLVQAIVENDLADEQDDTLKQIYTRELFNHYIGTHLDTSAHAAILARAKVLAQVKAKESHSDGSGEEEGY